MLAKSYALYQETENNVVGLNMGTWEKHHFHVRGNLWENWSEMDKDKSLIDKWKSNTKTQGKKGLRLEWQILNKTQTWHQGNEGSLQTGEQWAEKL